MKKVLFLIHDLGQGGAEKVLVNLVNNMDRTKFEITVMSLFGGGVNEQFLSKDIRYIVCHKKAYPGNSKIMKILSPKSLYRHFVKNAYDIVISYLEGPCARIISGCDSNKTNKICWIHIEQKTHQRVASSFRSICEAQSCYNRFDRIVCVSKTVKDDFTGLLNITSPVEVLYNTNESEKIVNLSKESVDNLVFDESVVKIICVGKLLKNKGFDRLLRIINRLIKNGKRVHLYILGIGPEESNLRKYIIKNGLSSYVTLLGYQTNPYKYIAKCDLFVCCSFSEGFSTAATEALIVGCPVCTVEVSGMKEMLGEHNEYGVVTDNNEEALYEGIKNLLDDSDLLARYKGKAKERGRMFSTKKTVQAVEDMLLTL